MFTTMFIDAAMNAVSISFNQPLCTFEDFNEGEGECIGSHLTV